MALDPETLADLIETVARFVRERCVPLERRIADEDRVPDVLVEEMRALGLFGFALPGMPRTVTSFVITIAAVV